MMLQHHDIVMKLHTRRLMTILNLKLHPVWLCFSHTHFAICSAGTEELEEVQ